MPCLISTGNIIYRARQPDFDPTQALLFMPTTSGPCRFGQYITLQRDILDQEGLVELDIISGSSKDSYQDFGGNPTKFRQLAWQGTVGLDLLQKLLHEYRPYELNQGQTDNIYQQGLARVVAATKSGGGKALVETMKWIANQFEHLPIDRSISRPIIGLVGEIYLRFNTYANKNIIRQVEAAGGEVAVASMMEWFYFTNWSAKKLNWSLGLYFEFFKLSLTDMYQQYHEFKLLKPVKHLLRDPHEPPVAKLMENIQPYFDPLLGGEATLSMGKAIHFAQSGLSGILNIMPFSCMAGIITAGMAPRFRADLDNIPWLDVIYDTQEETNINTRLEAFMYQAIQFQRQLLKNKQA